MKSKTDILGKKFDRLTVLEFLGVKNKNSYYKCKCDCGNFCEKLRNNLNLKRTNSCGCHQKEHLDKINHRLPNGEAAKRMLYKSYKEGAKRRGLLFELTIEQFEKLTKGNCRYCGIEASNSVIEHKSKLNKYNGDYIYNGIDRLDSSIGYIFENCDSCCTHCNIAKRSMNEKEFKEWIFRVYSKMFKK